jgi:hypothetical protein
MQRREESEQKVKTGRKDGKRAGKPATEDEGMKGGRPVKEGEGR